jgi:hypothetical protein
LIEGGDVVDNKVNVLTILDYQTAEILFKNGKIDVYDTNSSVPSTFKESIREFMRENVGYETGPIFCVVKLNGVAASLIGSDVSDGGLRLTDLLPATSGDVVVEFSVRSDSIVTIGMKRFMELVELSLKYGNDNEVLLEELMSGLCVGSLDEENNMFCFMASLDRKNCVRYALIDESWRNKYGLLFKGVEEGNVGVLNVF